MVCVFVFSLNSPIASDPADFEITELHFFKPLGHDAACD